MRAIDKYDAQSLEGTDELRLDFNKLNNVSGVIPVAIQNAETDEVILVAYTNKEAFDATVEKRKLILWSSSRQKLWFKGEESGNTFTVQGIFVNCEQNSLLYRVTPDRDNICHTSIDGVPNNCYYRQYDMTTNELIYSPARTL